MICSYCQGFAPSQSRFYQIDNVKERFIPTYYHHPIFAQQQPEPQRVRCSPTFHSKAMDLSGYHRCNRTANAFRPKNVASCAKIPKSTYTADYRRCKDETFYNYRGGSCYNSRGGCWYDGGKEEVLLNINDGRGYSRERKMVDLASSSVFEGYTIEPNRGTGLIDYRDQHEPIGQRQGPAIEGMTRLQRETVEKEREDVEVQTIDPNNAEENQQRGIVAEPANEQSVAQQEQVTFGKKDGRVLKSTKSKKQTSKGVKNAAARPCFTVIRSKK